MKNLSKLILIFALIFWGINTVKAQRSLKDDKTNKTTEVSGLLNNKDFVFEATKANPKKGGMPLSYHKYDVAIAKDTLVAHLPIYSGAGPVKFASTKYDYNATQGKNGSWDIVIKPNTNMSDVKQLRLKVTPSGHASLHVISNSHGPLELDGYIKQEDY